MKTLLIVNLLLTFSLCVSGAAQEEARAAWQISNFDITANVQQAERALNAIALLTARNVGRGTGTSFTFRINSKANIKSVTVGGANANFRSVAETRGNLQRLTVTLPTSLVPDATLNLSISYSLPVEINSGLTAISALGSQFLPLSFWYPVPNTPFTVRGADTAPFRLTVNATNVVSSGTDKSVSGGSTVYEQTLNAQPFLVQGDWDRLEGTGEGKGIAAYLPKGASPEERKQAEAIIAFTAGARSFYTTLLGPVANAPVRLVAVRRGSGFNDGGTVLLETGAFRRQKIDSATALLISEAIARIWLGGQVAVRGEGGGVIRDGLVRFLATSFLEKQFGRDAAAAEILRQRLAYASVAKRDAPLSRTTPLDDTYFNSVPNKGAMVWRLIERRMGRDAFMSTLREVSQLGNNTNGISLASLRAALSQRGGETIKTLLDQEIDLVTDRDLMIGLPQQRGAEWVSALRNLGSTDAPVTVTATSDRGEQVSVEATVPARNFSEAIFKTTARLVRAEIDPEKLYPQLDYGNDTAPRTRDVADAIAEATRQFGAQDYVKAESVAREVIAVAPRMQEARILLGRALLAQNKIDEAEKLFRATLDEPLPTASTLAWANIGLGEIAIKKGQAMEAAKRFNDAVRADADYASSLVARAGRIRAESGATSGPPVDDSVRAFIKQLDQAITSGQKAQLDSRIVPGELVKFINGIVGSQPEIWQTRVLRTEQLEANLVAADVSITAKELGQERAGTAVLILSRAGDGWKLASIDLFEVR